jgi:hypothetical protein
MPETGVLLSDRYSLTWSSLGAAGARVPLVLHSKNFLKQCARLVAQVRMPGNTERLPIRLTTSPRYPYVRPAAGSGTSRFCHTWVWPCRAARSAAMYQNPPWSLITSSYLCSALKSAERRHDVVPPGNTNCRTAPYTLWKCARNLLRPASGTWRLRKTYMMYSRCLRSAAPVFSDGLESIPHPSRPLLDAPRGARPPRLFSRGLWPHEGPVNRCRGPFLVHPLLHQDVQVLLVEVLLCLGVLGDCCQRVPIG